MTTGTSTDWRQGLTPTSALMPAKTHSLCIILIMGALWATLSAYSYGILQQQMNWRTKKILNLISQLLMGASRWCAFFCS